MFDFGIVTNWIHTQLTSLMPEGLAIFLECVIIGICLLLLYVVIAIIWNARSAPRSNAGSALPG